MAYIDRVSSTIQPRLEEGEVLVAALRSARRGATMIAAVAAGIGAAAGFLIATSGYDGGFAAAALGGGVGGGAGAAVGFGIAWRMGGDDLPTRNPYLVVARTDRRLLMLPRSPLTNRPTSVAAARPLAEVGSIAIGPKRFSFPRTTTIRFSDGSSWELEAMAIDEPEGFAAGL